MKILFGREEVNPDKPDRLGQTPLLGAAENGQERVVKVRLGGERSTPARQIDSTKHRSHGPLCSRTAIVSQNGSLRYGFSPKKRSLGLITSAPSLSLHATRRDALRHHPPSTGGNADMSYWRESALL